MAPKLDPLLSSHSSRSYRHMLRCWHRCTRTHAAFDVLLKDTLLIACSMISPVCARRRVHPNARLLFSHCFSLRKQDQLLTASKCDQSGPLDRRHVRLLSALTARPYPEEIHSCVVSQPHRWQLQEGRRPVLGFGPTTF